MGLTKLPRLALNSQSSCLSFLNFWGDGLHATMAQRCLRFVFFLFVCFCTKSCYTGDTAGCGLGAPTDWHMARLSLSLPSLTPNVTAAWQGNIFEPTTDVSLGKVGFLLVVKNKSPLSGPGCSSALPHCSKVPSIRPQLYCREHSRTCPPHTHSPPWARGITAWAGLSHR